MTDSAQYLTLKAGPAARAALADATLTPERVGALAGAAGGPKWLAIAAFYRALFTDWFVERDAPLPIVGSSIGAWAGAAACHPSDPGGAIDALTEAYIGQRYSMKPDAAEITTTLAAILDEVLTPEVRRGVLTHPRYRLHAMTVRSRWSTATDRRSVLAAGSVAAGLANAASRRWLGAFFERVVFARDGDSMVYAADGIASRTVALAADNLRDAIFASGNVPLIMQAVKNPAGAPPGLYRDGGLTDYHIDQPLLGRRCRSADRAHAAFRYETGARLARQAARLAGAAACRSCAAGRPRPGAVRASGRRRRARAARFLSLCRR